MLSTNNIITDFFFVSNSDSASSANTARRPPASANPASAHFLAKPHFHPNVTFGDFTDAHPHTRIGFRREFLPRRARCVAPTIIPFRTHGLSPFRVVWPCRPIAFRRLRLKRHASRNPSLHGHYPLRRYYGSIRLLPPCLRRDRSPKFPCRTFGTRHVPMPRPAGRVAKRLRRVRVGFGYHDPLDHGRPFG